MTSRFKLNTAVAALGAAALLAQAMPALAQSADLNTWTAAGDVVLGSATAATLTTAAVDASETPLSPNSALLYFDLEPALLLDPGSLPPDTFEGSGLQQSFMAAAGSTVSFNWSLSTQAFDNTQIDRAFVVIDGNLLSVLAPVAGGTVAGSFSHTFTSAGNHALALLVMDVDTADRISTLTISNFSVSAVPEPGTVAMMLAGLAGLGARCRRRQRQRAQP